MPCPGSDSPCGAAFTTPSSPIYAAYCPPYLVITSIFAALLTVMPVAVLTLFMQRKWSVPRLMVIAIPVSSAASLFDFLSLLYLSQEALGPYLDTQPMIQDLMSALIAPAIWTPYFVGSVRVRTTFVGQPIASRSR